MHSPTHPKPALLFYLLNTNTTTCKYMNTNKHNCRLDTCKPPPSLEYKAAQLDNDYSIYNMNATRARAMLKSNSNARTNPKKPEVRIKYK